jgi:hypothetical protein
MIITKKDPLSGQTNSIEIPITLKELNRVNDRFKTDELIQDIVPQLTESEREFLMTGITEETWNTQIDRDLPEEGEEETTH